MSFLFKKIKFSLVFWSIFYFLLASILLSGSFSYLDPDFSWHKKVGEKIIADYSVPSANIYNFSFTGNWVDHEWLSDAFIYLIERDFGYISLSILFAVLIIIVFRLLHLRAKKKWPGLPDWFSALWQLFAVLASLPHFGVRIQEFALLFLLLVLIILDKYKDERNFKILLWLTPAMWLWSMIHGSFLIGFFVMGLFVAVQFFCKKMSFKETLTFSGLAFIAFLSTLISPYGLRLYSFLYGYRDSYYLSHIQEWLPQSSFPFLYPQLIYLAFVVLALLSHFYSNRQFKKRIDWWSFVLTLVFTVLAFKSRRHFPLLVVASFPFLLETIGQALELGVCKKALRGQMIYLRWFRVLIIFLMLLIAVSQLIKTNFTSRPFENHCEIYPCRAKNFLDRNEQYDDLRLFNLYVWGGYLIHELPERQIFIDGRLPQVEYKGHSFLEEYYRFYSEDQEEIVGRLKEHAISLVLIPTTDKDLTARNWEKFLFGINDADLKVGNYLRDYLSSSVDWRLIYKDEVASIYQLMSE